MTEHTKEPWHLSQDGQHILSRTGELSFAHVAEVFHELDDARRIVACVNVCAGISTEALEGGTAPVLTADVARDAERYRWLLENARATAEHWGGRWSLVIDSPAPGKDASSEAINAAIDAAINRQGGE
jgi:hypothetical protein